MTCGAFEGITTKWRRTRKSQWSNCTRSYKFVGKKETTQRDSRLHHRVIHYAFRVEASFLCYFLFCPVLGKSPDDAAAFHCKIVCLVQQSKFKDVLQLLKSHRKHRYLQLHELIIRVSSSVLNFSTARSFVLRKLIAITDSTICRKQSAF